MNDFKPGDRVRFIYNGATGTVDHLDEDMPVVRWDDSPNELELCDTLTIVPERQDE